MHKFRLEPVLVLLTGLELDLTAFDHFFEHLYLAVLLIELSLMPLLLLFSLLLIALL